MYTHRGGKGGGGGITIKKRNANKTILLQLFLRDDVVVSEPVPAGKNNLFLYIGATLWLHQSL